VRIRTVAAAVNHTDLESRAGNWPVTKAPPFPYVPGGEVIGDIEETGQSVSDIRPGDRVITMMQGLDWSQVVPRTAVLARPASA
jgi:NADPH:quinone reductase